MRDNAYCRVYHSIVDDDKFAEVFDNDAALATWLRLLITADQAWPASAPLPASARRRAVDLLSRVELVDLLPGSRYRIHGLDAERNRRADSARKGAAVRWQSDRNATASGVRMPSRDEPRQAEPSQARALAAIDLNTREGLIHVTPLAAEAWQDASGLTLLGSGAFAMGRVDDACRRHPESKVIAAIQAARDTFDHIPDAAALVIAMRNILDPLPSGKEAQRAAAEQRAATASRRGVQATKRQIHDLGAHADEPDPMCDACKDAA